VKRFCRVRQGVVTVRRTLPAGLFFISFLVWGCSPSQDVQRHGQTFSGNTMGTFYHVTLGGNAVITEQEHSRLARTVQEALDDVEERMSLYKADSELSRFNRVPAGQPFIFSKETMSVFRTAQQVYELSGGAFDVTVEPLVDAWGFGLGQERLGPLSEDEVAQLRQQVGFHKLQIDYEKSSITKTAPALRCDLSAVAKGYGVDRVGQELMRLGYKDFMVEVGGEVLTRGRNRKGDWWRIAIERPDTLAPTAAHLVRMGDAALATSGDYRNYYEVDGVRYSHTIDPGTGRPVAHNLASVSVISSTCVFADAMATALNVLGPDKGYELALKQGLEAFFLVRTPGGGFMEKMTPALTASEVCDYHAAPAHPDREGPASDMH